MNKIILIGNLTRDPESNTTQGGVNFTRFTIAVNRRFTNANGERVADYFDVICWRKVGVGGSVQRRQYEDRDGIKRTSFDVVADEVEFLTPKQNMPGREPSGGGYMPEEPQNTISEMQPVDNDDLPF